MSGNTDNSLDFGNLEGDFVAYLDGEADAATSRRLEELIARDERARQRLRSLERTWGALDLLPRTRASERLASSTVEMLAVRADQEARAAEESSRNSDRGFWVTIGFVAMAAASLVFAGISHMARERNEQFLRNVLLYENLDQYRQIENIEELRSLSKQGQFDHELPDYGDPRL